MSSTIPTIIEHDGLIEMVVGGSGGSRILSAVLQTIYNYYEFGWSITKAVSSPRLHDQLFPDLCEMESGFPEDIKDSLLSKNHKLKTLPVGTYESVVQAIARTYDNHWEAVSDYRKGGQPAGH
jgi:gamma-glutamyltranspeptidase/glutathione hydrolase/leukotriene-C4 hydrolase